MFVSGGHEILSQEGVTQGCVLSMPIYALGLLPLLCTIKLGIEEYKIKQAAYADDLAGVGQLNELKVWWDLIVVKGPSIGYFAKPSKSWLIVKPEFAEEAEGNDIFKSAGKLIEDETRFRFLIDLSLKSFDLYYRSS